MPARPAARWQASPRRAALRARLFVMVSDRETNVPAARRGSDPSPRMESHRGHAKARTTGILRLCGGVQSTRVPI